jgi:branched-chain amino acid transport system permease protein
MASDNNIVRAFKDAGFWALVALGLFLPLIGFRTVQNIRNELALETRWPLLAVFVAIVAAGRLFHNLVVAPWLERRRLAARAPAAATGWASRLADALAPFAVGFALIYPAAAVWLAGTGGAVKWIDNFGIQILIYVMLGFGLNIVVGLAGLLDLGYVAFYAVGAYSYALLSQAFGLSFFTLLPLAGILAAFWGLSPTAMRASPAFRALPSSAFRSTRRRTALRRCSACRCCRSTGSSSSTTSSLRSPC